MVLTAQCYLQNHSGERVRNHNICASTELTVCTANKNDYNELYAEDDYLKELGNDAKVFNVYNDESDRYDYELVEGWIATLDTLLIFVSLFTTFDILFKFTNDVGRSLLSSNCNILHTNRPIAPARLHIRHSFSSIRDGSSPTRNVYRHQHKLHTSLPAHVQLLVHLLKQGRLAQQSLAGKSRPDINHGTHSRPRQTMVNLLPNGCSGQPKR